MVVTNYKLEEKNLVIMLAFPYRIRGDLIVIRRWLIVVMITITLVGSGHNVIMISF